MITNILTGAFGHYKIYLIIAATLAVLGSEFVVVRNFYVSHYEAQILDIKNTQLVEQNEVLQRLRTTETDLAHSKDVLERQNVENKQKIKKLHSHYASVVASTGLYDPGVQKPSNDGRNTPGSAGNNEGSCGDRRLSDEASRFLLDLTEEADEVVEDYKTCYGWVQKIQEILKPKN